MTNADKIRAMSDEELVDFVDRGWGCPYCEYEPECDVFQNKKFICKEGIRLFLTKEREE